MPSRPDTVRTFAFNQMNKLKRPALPKSQSSPPSTSISRTLALASGYASNQVVAAPKATSLNIHPRTNAEHYWAARALKAECLISARMTHEDEIRTLRTFEETKRSVRLHNQYQPPASVTSLSSMSWNIYDGRTKLGIPNWRD